MTARAPTNAIVVGIDASVDGDRAVTWALALAARTGQPVHFEHVLDTSYVPEVDPSTLETWAAAGRALLDSAVAQAEQVPGVRATSHLADTGLAPAAALAAASQDTAMLVVGARGHGGYAGLLMGSVSQHVARHASCPVIAVRRPSAPDETRVVVGVDPSEGAEVALGLALQLASDVGAPVTAIHALRAPAMYGVGVALPLPTDTGQAIIDAERAFAEQLAPWRAKFPSVTLTSEVIPGHPTAVLTDASEHAALVVVGRRGLGAFAEMLLGSVSQSVLHHAKCPVAVAH